MYGLPEKLIKKDLHESFCILTMCTIKKAQKSAETGKEISPGDTV